MKTCTKCGESKAASCFHVQHCRENRPTSRCKDCHSSVAKKRREGQPDSGHRRAQKAKAAATFRAKHPEIVKANREKFGKEYQRCSKHRRKYGEVLPRTSIVSCAYCGKPFEATLGHSRSGRAFHGGSCQQRSWFRRAGKRSYSYVRKLLRKQNSKLSVIEKLAELERLRRMVLPASSQNFFALTAAAAALSKP